MKQKKQKQQVTWVVYHGGALYGLGRWSDGHRTKREALASAEECRRVVGGDPWVEREDN